MSCIHAFFNNMNLSFNFWDMILISQVIYVNRMITGTKFLIKRFKLSIYVSITNIKANSSILITIFIDLTRVAILWFFRT